MIEVFIHSDKLQIESTCCRSYPQIIFTHVSGGKLSSGGDLTLAVGVNLGVFLNDLIEVDPENG